MNPRSAQAVDVLAEVSGNSLAETYRVWAPRADSVALEVNGEPCHMHRDDRAWWAADRRMRPGDLYGFVLDGRGPFRIREATASLRACTGPRKSSTTRATNGPRRDGSLRHSPQACSTSCTWGRSPRPARSSARSSGCRTWSISASPHVELMPVAEFSGDRGWGYDGVRPVRAAPCYGTPDELKRLVDAAMPPDSR